jgi:hypothetical protein
MSGYDDFAAALGRMGQRLRTASRYLALSDSGSLVGAGSLILAVPHP